MTITGMQWMPARQTKMDKQAMDEGSGQMRSNEERRAYARGYHAGINNRWPEHKPPIPPNEILAELISSVCGLRDEADNMCATLSEDEEFTLRLGQKIDKVDEALTAVAKWLKEKGQ